MFKKIYKPSVKANNELKDKVLKEVKAIVYKVEKGKYDGGLDKEIVESVLNDIKVAAESLEYAICTGEENVGAIAEDVRKQIAEFKKQASQDLSNKIESAGAELVYSINLWKDVLDGNAVLETEEDVKKAKKSHTVKVLETRLNELDGIKEGFSLNAKRIDKDIVSEEKDLAELEEQMLGEDSERKINDLYRRIKATKSKIDMLSIRRGNYSACKNLLDMIYANAKEILSASEFSVEEATKAKVLLNIAKLKQVESDPDKAMAILKRMEKELKSVEMKTKSIDEKVFGLDSGSATVNEDALKYKEELMRKKREKEGLNEEIANGGSAVIEKDEQTLKGEN